MVNLILMISLALFMFGLGLSLTIRDFLRLRRDPKLVAIGLIAQNIFLPLLAFLIISLVDVDPIYAFGLLLVAFSPGGPTSNFFAFLAKGDVALSVTLTSITSVLNVFLLPLILPLVLVSFLQSDTTVSLPVHKTFIRTFGLVLTPMILGMLTNARAPRLATKLLRPMRVLALGLLTTVVCGFVAKEWVQISQGFAEIGMLVILLLTSAMTFAFCLSRSLRLEAKQERSIVIEVGIQNAAQAIFIASSPALLNDPTMALPAILYGLLMYVFVFGYLSYLHLGART